MFISRGSGRTVHRARRLFVMLLAALPAFGMADTAAWTPQRAEASGSNLAVNPGFEDSDEMWTGWIYDGTLKNGDTPAIRLSVDQGDDYVHGGGNSLAYWLDEPFSFRLTQTLTGLQDGEYELAAWAMGGEASMAGSTSLKLIAESGGQRVEKPIDVTAWTEWRRYTLAGAGHGRAVIVSRDMSSLNFTIEEMQLLSQKTINAAQIFIGALPVQLVYPFLQRFFVKGLVLGSVKG
jgi:hypothetical protein